ncbi:MAG: NAD(P)H-hydrate dehydratase [Deltaproteobacteria bacterium]|nr:NAD(P)H-hydrate dehydratase [Deltaproteobacteria bacterium]
MKALTAAQMREVDRRTIDEIGIPGVVLMENAGRGVAEEIIQRFSPTCAPSALILAGKGNNGGDGYVIARHLMNKGWDVKTLVLAEREAIKGDAAVNLFALEKCGGQIDFVSDNDTLKTSFAAVNKIAVLVDALFGTGLTKPAQGLYLQAIEWLNRQTSPVVAVDISSGVDASTGQVLGTAVNADLTVSFAFAKIGQVSYPGAGLAGELVVVDIGVPEQIAGQTSADCLLTDAAEGKSLLPVRSQDGHKGTFGHLLVVAGSTGKGGAAVMAAESGLRGGAGLVTLACPQSAQPILASQLTEVMTVPLVDFKGELSLQALDALQALTGGKQALAIGPGLGLGEEVGGLIRRLVQDSDLPMVIDADGLTALCGHMHILERQAERQLVLTPHPGEMARLTGLSIAEVQADRFTVARDFAVRHRVVLILKGARTLIASPAGRVHVNSSGHAGLASGGMGDVLTGLVGSLLAQGLAAPEAATLGVYLHGLAADRLLPTFGDAGLLATDVMYELPAARQALAMEA